MTIESCDHSYFIVVYERPSRSSGCPFCELREKLLAAEDEIKTLREKEE